MRILLFAILAVVVIILIILLKGCNWSSSDKPIAEDTSVKEKTCELQINEEKIKISSALNSIYIDQICDLVKSHTYKIPSAPVRRPSPKRTPGIRNS